MPVQDEIPANPKYDELLRQDYVAALASIESDPMLFHYLARILGTRSELEKLSDPHLWLRKLARKNAVATAEMLASNFEHFSDFGNQRTTVALLCIQVIQAASGVLYDLHVDKAKNIELTDEESEYCDIVSPELGYWMSRVWGILYPSQRRITLSDSDATHMRGILIIMNDALSTLRIIMLSCDPQATAPIRSSLKDTSVFQFSFLGWLTCRNAEEALSWWSVVDEFGQGKGDVDFAISPALVNEAFRSFGPPAIGNRLVTLLEDAADPEMLEGWHRRFMITDFLRSAAKHPDAPAALKVSDFNQKALRSCWLSIRLLRQYDATGHRDLLPSTVASIAALLREIVQITGQKSLLDLVSKEDLLPLVARLPFLLSQCDPRMAQKGENDSHQPIDLKQNEDNLGMIAAADSDLDKIVKRLCSVVDKTLLKAIRKELLPIFLRTLEALRCFNKDPRLQSFIKSWQAIGHAVEVDEAKLLQDQRAKKAGALVGCSWEKCVLYHSPTHLKFLLCRGCGKAQYCGTEPCQTRDWQEGGHDKLCSK